MHGSGWFMLALCILYGIMLLGLGRGIAEGALVLASLLVHEMGHIVVALMLGVPVREFGLCWLGAYNRRADSRERRTEILISLAGPLTNILLAFPMHYVPVIGNQLALCNLLLGIFNLLPIPSSDGLRILHNIRGTLPQGGAIPALSEAPSAAIIE
jgi:Zn-dependent protease